MFYRFSNVVLLYMIVNDLYICFAGLETQTDSNNGLAGYARRKDSDRVLCVGFC